MGSRTSWQQGQGEGRVDALPTTWPGRLHRSACFQVEQKEYCQLPLLAFFDDSVPLTVLHLANVPLNRVSNYEKRSLSDFASRLRGNQLKKQCRVVYNCVKDASKVTIAAGYTGWVAAAERAKPAGQSLMQFLNQPFWANAGGVAIAGMISGGVLKAASCSKSNNEADIIKAVVAEALRASPGADKIEVTVGGPYGTWNVVIAATGRDHYPPPTCRR